MYPEWAYPDAPVFILEVPMPRIPSTIGQGPTVTISIPLAASADPYILSELAVPPGTDVTVQLIGTGGGGGGAQTVGSTGGGGGGSPAGVVFVIPAATWAADGTLVLPFGGVGGGVNGNGETGENTELEIGSNLVQLIGGGMGVSASGDGGAGGTVNFSAADFTLVNSRPGKAGDDNAGTAGGAGGVLSWGGTGGTGGTSGGAAAGNGSDARAVIQFTPSAS